MSRRVDLGSAQRRLATMWFSVGGLLFVLLVAQSLLGRYGDRATDAWGWLLPALMPTLSLIVGTLVTGARRAREARSTVDRFFYRLSLGLSAAYLATLSATVLLSPLAERMTGSGPLELMQTSQLWLAPFQGLVAAALGAFFIGKEPQSS